MKQIAQEELAGRNLMFSLLPEAKTKLFAGMFTFVNDSKTQQGIKY